MGLLTSWIMISSTRCTLSFLEIDKGSRNKALVMIVSFTCAPDLDKFTNHDETHAIVCAMLDISKTEVPVRSWVEVSK